MRLARAHILLPLLASGLALAGCYGNTEPATNLAPDRATLNARGTADKGAAYSYFEYWRAAAPGDTTQTQTWHWPAGASAPLSNPITPRYLGDAPLLQHTSYEFRVCGNDEGKPAVCTPARGFATPSGDAVDGTWQTSSDIHGIFANIHAWSGPSGEKPQGTISEDEEFRDFSGTVTCLTVHGTTAAVGAVGTFTHVNAGNPDTYEPGWELYEVEETGNPDGAKVDLTFGTGTTPPVCPGSPAVTSPPVGAARFVIQDG